MCKGLSRSAKTALWTKRKNSNSMNKIVGKTSKSILLKKAKSANSSIAEMKPLDAKASISERLIENLKPAISPITPAKIEIFNPPEFKALDKSRNNFAVYKRRINNHSKMRQVSTGFKSLQVFTFLATSAICFNLVMF